MPLAPPSRFYGLPDAQYFSVYAASEMTISHSHHRPILDSADLTFYHSALQGPTLERQLQEKKHMFSRSSAQSAFNLGHRLSRTFDEWMQTLSTSSVKKT
jgi:hypothetical protein